MCLSANIYQPLRCAGPAYMCCYRGVDRRWAGQGSTRLGAAVGGRGLKVGAPGLVSGSTIYWSGALG